MSYRRPHHRRSHIRTNADGSKSFVKETDVKGHNYERGNKDSYNGSTHTGDALDELLAIVALAGFILLVLGVILCWEETLWYILVCVIPLALLYIRHKL